MDQVEIWNQAVFVALNARPGTAHWMLAAAEAIANDLIYLVPLALVLEGETLLGLACLGTGLLVAWARLYLGVHFPLDMLAAAGVAAFMYALVTPVWRRLGDRATLLVEQVYGRAMAWPISRRWVRP